MIVSLLIAISSTAPCSAYWEVKGLVKSAMNPAMNFCCELAIYLATETLIRAIWMHALFCCQRLGPGWIMNLVTSFAQNLYPLNLKHKHEVGIFSVDANKNLSGLTYFRFFLSFVIKYIGHVVVEPGSWNRDEHRWWRTNMQCFHHRWFTQNVSHQCWRLHWILLREPPELHIGLAFQKC